MHFNGSINSNLLFKKNCVRKYYNENEIVKYEREKSFYLFANSKCNTVPQLLNFDDKRRYIEIERISGLTCTEMNLLYRRSLLSFLNALNDGEVKVNLPLAAEAVLKPNDLKIHMRKRFSYLKEYCQEDFFKRKVDQISKFIDECVPLIKNEKTIISPSDIGLHNSILCEQQIYFIDFEYAGIDGYTKLIYDFILHPANNIKPHQYSKIFHLMQGELLGCTIVYEDEVMNAFKMWWILRLLQGLCDNYIENRIAIGVLASSLLDKYKTDRRTKINLFWENIN
jgi:tRNA A-37 threonylcarbamoyl transferase component Bud32